jgi:hypothetical protein
MASIDEPDRPQRVESDDDLDLLTYNEARVRLAEEVAAEQRRYDELASEASRKRLAALRERLDGITAPRITPANADKFYGTHSAAP